MQENCAYMTALNLPPIELAVKREKGKFFVFDSLRRRYVAYTPEEEVRQRFVYYLTEKLHYPAALMANEVTVTLNGMNRRCDTVLYDRDLMPRMIMEYKAPTVEITQKVFMQISNYNLVLKVDYLVVSNGLSHYCCQMDYEHRTYRFLSEIPDYLSLRL